VETRCASVSHLVPEYRLIDALAAAAAIFRWPPHADVTGSAQLAAEACGELGAPSAVLFRVAVNAPRLRGELPRAGCASLGTEGELLRRKVEIHASSAHPTTPAAWSSSYSLLLMPRMRVITSWVCSPSSGALSYLGRAPSVRHGRPICRRLPAIGWSVSITAPSRAMRSSSRS